MHQGSQIHYVTLSYAPVVLGGQLGPIAKARGFEIESEGVERAEGL